MMYVHYLGPSTMYRLLNEESVNENRLLTKIFQLNPIPTGHGPNQPIYDHHVTTAGWNRVKLALIEFWRLSAP